MRRVRDEADKMEVDGGPDYSDASTPLPAPDFEGMGIRDLKAAVRCRGGRLRKEGNKPPDSDMCKKWLREYLARDTS